MLWHTKNDVQSAVVLASGSVRVNAKDGQVKLVPNEMFSYSEQRGGLVKRSSGCRLYIMERWYLYLSQRTIIFYP